MGQGVQRLWTDESKFEIFMSNWRVKYLRRRVGKRAATSSITETIKQGGGSVMLCVWVGVLPIVKLGFTPGEEQIESDCLLKHTAALRDPI